MTHVCAIPINIKSSFQKLTFYNFWSYLSLLPSAIEASWNISSLTVTTPYKSLVITIYYTTNQIDSFHQLLFATEKFFNIFVKT